MSKAIYLEKTVQVNFRVPESKKAAFVKHAKAFLATCDARNVLTAVEEKKIDPTGDVDEVRESVYVDEFPEQRPEPVKVKKEPMPKKITVSLAEEVEVVDFMSKKIVDYGNIEVREHKDEYFTKDSDSGKKYKWPSRELAIAFGAQQLKANSKNK